MSTISYRIVKYLKKERKCLQKLLSVGSKVILFISVILLNDSIILSKQLPVQSQQKKY